MITSEAWTPGLLIVNALQLNELSALQNTFYPEYKYVCMYVCMYVCVCVCVCVCMCVCVCVCVCV